MTVPVTHHQLYYVYKIGFRGTNRVYIGYTSSTPKKRFDQHWKQRNKLNTPLAKYLRTIQKGESSVETLYITDDKEDALNAEVEYIKNFYSMINQKGFNGTMGGEYAPKGFGGSSWTINYSEEEIKQINKKKGRKGIENGFYGRTHNERTLKRAVETRRINGSYKNASSHLTTESQKRKTTELKKNNAAKRYGFSCDKEYVNEVVRLYKYCVGSYRWIANLTNSNHVTVRKRILSVLSGEYGDKLKEIIESTPCLHEEQRLLQVLGREKYVQRRGY